MLPSTLGELRERAAVLQMNPDDAAAHFWLGGNYGSYGKAKGVEVTLEMDAPSPQDPEVMYRLVQVIHMPGGSFEAINQALTGEEE